MNASDPKRMVLSRLTESKDQTQTTHLRASDNGRTSPEQRGTHSAATDRTISKEQQATIPKEEVFWFTVPVTPADQQALTFNGGTRFIFEKILGRALRPSEVVRKFGNDFTNTREALKNGHINAWMLKKTYFRLRTFTAAITPNAYLSEREEIAFPVERRFIQLYDDYKSKGESSKITLLMDAFAIREVNDFGNFIDSVRFAYNDYHAVSGVLDAIDDLDEAAFARYKEDYINQQRNVDDRRILQTFFVPIPERDDYGSRALTTESIQAWRQHVNAFERYISSIIDMTRLERQKMEETIKSFGELKKKFREKAGLYNRYREYKKIELDVLNGSYRLKQLRKDASLSKVASIVLTNPQERLRKHRESMEQVLNAEDYTSLENYENELKQFRKAFIDISKNITLKILRDTQLLLLERPGLNRPNQDREVKAQLRTLDRSVWLQYKDRILAGQLRTKRWNYFQTRYNQIKSRYPVLVYDGIDWIDLAHKSEKKGHSFDRAVDVNLKLHLNKVSRFIDLFENSAEKLIFKADLQFALLKEHLGIKGIPTLEAILGDRQRELADQELFGVVVEILIAIALSIVSLGAGIAGFIARLANVGLAIYDINRSMDSYVVEKALVDLKLSSDDPSVAWLLVDVAFLGLEVADVKKVLKAAVMLDAEGDLNSFSKVLRELEGLDYRKRNTLEKLASVKTSMKNALDNFKGKASVLYSNAPLHPSLYKAAYDIGIQVFKRSIMSFRIFLLELETKKVIKAIERLPTEELAEFKKVFDEIVEQGSEEVSSIAKKSHVGSLVGKGTQENLIREVFGRTRLRKLIDGFKQLDEYLPSAITEVLGRTTGKSKLDIRLSELEDAIERIMLNSTDAISAKQEAVVRPLLAEAAKLARRRWDELRPRLWKELYKSKDVRKILKNLEADGLITLPRGFPNSGRPPRAISGNRDGIFWLRAEESVPAKRIADEIGVSEAYIEKRLKEIRRRIEAGKSALSEKGDSILWHLTQEQLPTKQIASKLGISEAEVKKRQKKIRKKLKEAKSKSALLAELPLNLDHITPIALNPFRFFDLDNLRVLTASYNDTFLRLFQLSSVFPMTEDRLEDWIRRVIKYQEFKPTGIADPDAVNQGL